MDWLLSWLIFSAASTVWLGLEARRAPVLIECPSNHLALHPQNVMGLHPHRPAPGRA